MVCAAGDVPTFVIVNGHSVNTDKVRGTAWLRRLKHPIANRVEAADTPTATTAIERAPALAHAVRRIKKAGLERPAGKGRAYEGVGQEWPILPL